MPQELSLDDMANEMRNQQGLSGKSSNKKLAWNPKKMKFEAFGSTESVPVENSVTNDVSGKGFYI